MRIAYYHQGTKQVFDKEAAEVVVGRRGVGLPVDLDLAPDSSVSRPHARILKENDQYWIEDLGSKHGTFVDEVDIRGKGKVALTPGVNVRMGNTTLVLIQRPLRPRVSVHVEAKCLPTVNYSLAHADVPFLSEVTLFNDGDAPLMDVELQIILPGYAESQGVTISTIPAKGSHTVSPLLRLPFYHHKLRELPELEIVPLQVRVNDERARLTPEVEVKVLPPNAWHCGGHEAALAGFVMPNSDAIKEVFTRAHFYLSRLFKKEKVETFADALESPDPNKVENMIMAFYYCLQERYHITYELEPRYYESDWQAVRFHYQVLGELAGTCIDLAVFFAACLEKVFLDPVIILVHTGTDPQSGYEIQHALVGCWREDSPIRNSIVWDGATVLQWVDARDLLLLDSIGFAYGKGAEQSFPDCKAKASEHLKKACEEEGDYRFAHALDIFAARAYNKVTPMPFGKGVQFERAAWLAIFRARQEAETLRSPAVGARHLLLGLLSLDNGLMRQVFASFGHDMVDEVADVARQSLPDTNSEPRPLPEDENWQTVMRRAEEAAKRGGDLLVTEAELAAALLETPSQVDRVLAHFGLNRQKCLEKLKQMVTDRPLPSEWHSSGFTR